MSNPCIMLCDDNISVHQTLTLYLREANYDVISVYDGQEALDTFRREHIDLIILDIMLPKLFGTDVCREIRKTSDVPIIMLSAKGDESDRIVGLELGADDYVTKPFSSKEMVARVKSVLRRTQSHTEIKALQIGNLTINPKAYEVYVAGDQIKMTPREVSLLVYLVSNAGQVVAREDILDNVWGKDYYGDVRAVDTLIARIRSKIHEHQANVSFHTVYGVGYMIRESK